MRKADKAKEKEAKGSEAKEVKEVKKVKEAKKAKEAKEVKDEGKAEEGEAADLTPRKKKEAEKKGKHRTIRRVRVCIQIVSMYMHAYIIYIICMTISASCYMCIYYCTDRSKTHMVLNPQKG